MLIGRNPPSHSHKTHASRSKQDDDTAFLTRTYQFASMDTVERGAIALEKDTHRNEGDAERGLGHFDAPATGEWTKV
jgi:hypothetical protein